MSFRIHWVETSTREAFAAAWSLEAMYAAIDNDSNNILERLEEHSIEIDGGSDWSSVIITPVIERQTP